LPRHTPVNGLLEALGALLEWPAAEWQSPPPAQRTLHEEDLLHLLEHPDPDTHEWAGEVDHPSLDAAAAAAASAAATPARGIVRDLDMLSLLLADPDAQESYASSESSCSGPAAAVRAEAARVAGSPPPPATNSAAGQLGQVPPPADPADAGPGHAADTAAADSDTICGASGPAPAEQESALRRWLCRAESAAGGMDGGGYDIPGQKPTAIEVVEFISGYSVGE
jgi:hypothetical protein